MKLKELKKGDFFTPEDFYGHSMSVSDIVEYPDGRLWFCDSLGWKEIEWQSN